MATKIFNQTRSKSFSLLTDAGGATYVLKPNGKKHYYLTTAITANVTLDDAVASAPVAGDTAETSHATGLSIMFVSDGTKWQVHTASNLSPGTHVAALQENSGAIGGTNDGNLPDLTATYVARTGAGGGTANGAYEDEGTLSTSNTYSDAAVNTVIGKLKNNIVELATVVAQLAADNVALRAAVRENAAKQNAVISSLEGNAVLASS